MKHRELDQFFTTPLTAKLCLEFLLSYIDSNKISWIEPSAGSGVFLNAAKNVGFPNASAAYDLMPQADGVELANFLEKDLSSVFKEKTLRLCLGNPPFGKNSSLAVKFFNHASKNCDMIAMIFPATFAKDSLKNKLDKSFHLVGELDLGSTFFDFVEEKRLVPVVFQIWKKSDVKRINADKKLTSKHFLFVSKEEADFAIQRVGAAAGKVKLNLEGLASASHYFIKAVSADVKEKFESIDWVHIKYKTAGNPSIAKPELISELEKLF